MVNAGIFVLGVLIAGFGIVAPALGIPLNAVQQNSGSPGSTISVSCLPGGSCTIQATLVNNGATDYFLMQASGATSATASGCAGIFFCALYNSGVAFPLLAGQSVSWAVTIPVSGGCLGGFECQGGTFYADVCMFSATSGATFCLTPSTYASTAAYAQTSFTWAPSTTTSSTTTTTGATETGLCIAQGCPFYLDIESGVTLSNVNPSGFDACNDTFSCQFYNGIRIYTGYWPTGTTVSFTVTFPSSLQVQVCTLYSTGNNACAQVASGQPFQLTVQPPGQNGVPSGAILEPSTAPNQPVTVSTCASGPGAGCAANDPTGGWSPGSTQLSASGSLQATFTWFPAAGYNCPTNWYLISANNGAQVESGENPCNGVSITWSQASQWENAYGTSLILYDTGAEAKTATLTIRAAGQAVQITGGPCTAAPQCTYTLEGSQTYTFLATCPNFTICDSVTWNVNGQIVPGDQNGMTYSFTVLQNWAVVATGSSATTTATTSTTAATHSATTTTTSTGTTSTTSSPGLTLPFSVTMQQGIEGLGAIVAVAGLAMPGPRTATKK